ncbi:MAG: NAD(P)-dependent oxidoreductase [Planctomycetaceae bacterium]|jgi:nucleoside-diphosphate-sugar epimerase|nr:NAD(P)-dependent oxidoreductase [Planctomycetaceae bacterium]MBT6157289.1 NAD(P)-dependent oxidoreductase [Planctomycetaceae bacterium]MBT6487705.1 NAD(P)-dependent oxidoreductase [Planctomycetaceae bacterium]MBT6493912.1 NAD(P)-dependent oxidoreductase [Planctomycetaceae bacterium]
MNRIVVTGGAGRLGRRVISDLIERGYGVSAVDIVSADDLGCPFQQMDLTDRDAVCRILEGAKAVMHLGAVPGPTVASGPVTFRNNVLSTYNVVEVAAELGLSKIVFASSLFTIGWAEDANCYWPEYVPVDEQHPLTPFESYGLSKVIGEEICAAASRRTGIPTVSLRITNIIQPEKFGELPWPAPTQSEPIRFTLWPYVAVEDAADACRLALETETKGKDTKHFSSRRVTVDLIARRATC